MSGEKIMHIKQLTETIHVDHMKSSHDYPRINDDFIQFVYFKYIDLEILEVKETRGKKYN